MGGNLLISSEYNKGTIVTIILDQKIGIDNDKDNYDSYVAKCKKNIEEKVDWHNNAEYNNGKSANKVYMETIFESDKPITNRYQGPMRRVMGALGEYRECAEEIIGSTAKTRPMKLIFAIVGGVAVLSGAYMLYRNSHKNSTQKMDKVA